MVVMFPYFISHTYNTHVFSMDRFYDLGLGFYIEKSLSEFVFYGKDKIFSIIPCWFSIDVKSLHQFCCAILKSDESLLRCITCFCDNVSDETVKSTCYSLDKIRFKDRYPCFLFCGLPCENAKIKNE